MNFLKKYDYKIISVKINISDDQEKKKIRHARQKRLRKLFSEFDNYEWKCANCDEKPADLNDLRDHYNNVHRVLPKYICNECGKQFDVYDYFKRHVRAHRDKDKYWYDFALIHYLFFNKS